MLTLRPYQHRAVVALRDAYRAGARRLLLVSPVGSGKTIMAGALIAQNQAKGFRAVFVAHRLELLLQPLRLLHGMGLHCGLIKAGHIEDRSAPVQVASVATLARRDKPPADLVVIDEAHRAQAATYRQVLESYPDAAVCGLTASPHRLDGRGLGDCFDVLIEAATPAELIRDGWIVPSRTFAPHVPELGAAKGADYTHHQISDAMDRGELIGNAVEHWQRLAADRPTICFCSSVRHSKRVAERFRAAGIDAVHIDGKTPDEERAAAWQHQIVCNVDLAVEGIDVPRLSCASVLRPTASLTRHIQMLGRIARPHKDKTDALILDHAGNVLRHGYLDAPRSWTLDGREDRRRDPALWVCSHCFAVAPAGAKICPSCGRARVVVPTSRRIKAERRGQLIEQAVRAKAERTPIAEKRKAWTDLQRTAAVKGYRPEWARIQYRLRFGEEPPR